MIWAKREFKFADYSCYHTRFADLYDRLYKLHGPTGAMMVKAGKGFGLSDVIICVPGPEYLTQFDGFQIIDESELPEEAAPLYVNLQTDDFERRFKTPDYNPRY
jgi:hypothetical protein